MIDVFSLPFSWENSKQYYNKGHFNRKGQNNEVSITKNPVVAEKKEKKTTVTQDLAALRLVKMLQQIKMKEAKESSALLNV